MNTLALLLAAAVAPAVADREITVRLDPVAHRIEGEATLRLARMGPGEPVLELHPGLSVEEVLLDGTPVDFERIEPRATDAPARIAFGLREPRAGRHRYTVRYAGEIRGGGIRPEGVLLAPDSRWYPAQTKDVPATYRVDVTVPPGWEAVSEGSRSAREEEGSVRRIYDAGFPVNGVHLLAGPWERVATDRGGVSIAVYFLPENGRLAPDVLEAAAVLLDRHAERFGPYPYDRFDVVESAFPMGHGGPGFTVLADRALLGREIARGWWGNGVRVAESGGDWSEGLALYVAEHEARRADGDDAAAAYRRDVCRDHFDRDEASTRADGEGKAMMVFHMLERRIGRLGFDEVLRDVFASRLHDRVSWGDWERAFSAGAGEDLGWFFDQWVGRPGAPELVLTDVAVGAAARTRRGISSPEGSYAGDEAFEVRGVLRQRGGRWRVRVPVVFEGEGSAERRTVEIAAEVSPFRFRLPFRPSVVRVDPDQNVFRRPGVLEIEVEPGPGNPGASDPVSR